jgi:hypothetical protein
MNDARTSGFFGIWLLLFVVIEYAGTALASWSWWWVLMPVVPVLAHILTRLGLMN